jgi:hypothetical protein
MRSRPVAKHFFIVFNTALRNSATQPCFKVYPLAEYTCSLKTEYSDAMACARAASMPG